MQIKKFLVGVLLVGILVNLGLVFAEDAIPAPDWIYKTGGNIGSVAISSDGNYIVAGCNDRYVYFFDKNGNLLWKYKTGGLVWSVAISSDGKYIVAGSYDNSVYFFDKNGNLLWKYKTGDAVSSVAITPD